MFTTPLTNALIKPSGPDCNLNCTYCFYLEKLALFEQQKHRMSPEVQEEMIRQLMQQSGEYLSISWQGGEPTLMGLDFYRRAVELEKKYGHGKPVDNGFQTNGLLLDKDWAKFFSENNWLVGLSLDGPKHIHDHYRIDRAGNGTHERVEDRAKMLLAEGVMVNAMCCVTSYSVKYPEELYNYYKKMGLTYMQFIPVVETDKNDPSKAADFSVSSEDYGHFLNALFDLWLADFINGEPTTSVRHFESIFYGYVGFPAPECTMKDKCGSYVVVEHNGNVYSCDFFVEPEWQLGNVMQNQIIEMLNSQKQQEFGLLKTHLPFECKQCKWLKKCYGGCTKDKMKDPRDGLKPRFCTSYKIFFEHADEALKNIAEQWKHQQGQDEPYYDPKTYNAFEDFNG